MVGKAVVLRAPVLLAAVAIALVSCGAGGRGDSSSVSGAGILALQMFNTSTGVAMTARTAPCSPRCPGESLAGGAGLAVTTDGGDTWRVTGTVPAPEKYAFPRDVRLVFLSPTTGYLEAGGAIAYTSDGGRRWIALDLPGPATSLSVSQGILLTVSAICDRAETPVACRTDLVEFRVGSQHPLAQRPIPSSPLQPTEANPGILLRLGPSSIVVGQGGSDGPTALWRSDDSGRHWVLLTNPCTQLVLTNVIAPAGRWLLYCERSGGMNHGHGSYGSPSTRATTGIWMPKEQYKGRQ